MRPIALLVNIDSLKKAGWTELMSTADYPDDTGTVIMTSGNKHIKLYRDGTFDKIPSWDGVSDGS